MFYIFCIFCISYSSKAYFAHSSYFAYLTFFAFFSVIFSGFAKVERSPKIMEELGPGICVHLQRLHGSKLIVKQTSQNPAEKPGLKCS
jgi:hypothetical protein